MSRRARNAKIFNGIYNLYAFIVFAFLYIPVIVMVGFSFNNSRNNLMWKSFTTKWYSVLMQDTEIWKVLGDTLIIGVLSTVLAVVIGTMGAVGMSKVKFKAKTIINVAMYIPIIIPEIVLAVATLLVLRKVNYSFGVGAMTLGNTTLVMPYVFITVKSRLVGMDPTIEEASLDLGANRRYTFLHVTVPQILPGIISGAFMAFTLAFDDLIICNFMADAATTTLPMKVYSQMKRGISPEINAMSTLILLGFLAVIGIYVTINALIKHKQNKEESMARMELEKKEAEAKYEYQEI